MKKLVFFLLFVAGYFFTSAQLKSPDAFLGYTLGTKFTPHYKIQQYFDHVLINSNGNIRLENYGKTYEGRDLFIAVVSSTENMSAITEIRKNNLRLTGLLKDGQALANNKNIVWLSYNVHGNEASSSEVSMQLLYNMVSGNNPDLNAWLKNTVVIIDPCLNPDGRDRYVNWYNSVVGKTPNPAGIAREHNEPWPGGRSNHYNFDLNRDWAWQTQVESEQRVKKYMEWMPQIHCDFHEQYPNNPYYFAPAAEPFHAAITNWQREAQTGIGRNHARYFDEKGWLYFTKESFDLLYPSYGDTYPTFNGAIGMTYEQAGHGISGLAIALNQYDTLKLADRIAHHYVTSLSTIEYASKNAEKLQSNFKKYFDDANSGKVTAYQSYILSGSNIKKLAAVTALLDKNKIAYSYANSAQAVSAYNYYTQKTENYTVKPNDLIIQSAQPQSVLLNVLFDESPKLSDTATYDITAWAIPYAFGVPTYASKVKIKDGAVKMNMLSSPTSVNAYAYLVNYQSFEDGKFLAALLKNGFRVRFTERELVYKSNQFGRGSLIILAAENKDRMALFAKLAHGFSINAKPVETGFMDSGFDFGSDKIRSIAKPRVAMLTGSGVSSLGAGEVWHLFDEQLNYPLTQINVQHFAVGDLKDIDVLIVPDGRYGMLSSKEQSIELKDWVKQGGKIIAIENAVSEMAKGEWGIKLKKEDDEKESKEGELNIKRYEDREREDIVNNIPGAIYRLYLDVSHPLAFGYNQEYYALKTNGRLYEASKDSWNVGVIKDNKPVAGFVGNALKNKLKNGTLISAQQMGNGNVIYFTDDPVFRSFWENGKLMLFNAVFLVGN